MQDLTGLGKLADSKVVNKTYDDALSLSEPMRGPKGDILLFLPCSQVPVWEHTFQKLCVIPFPRDDTMPMNTNAVMNGSAPKIAAIELHDSILAGLTVHCGGNGSLSFDHLNVFVEKSPNQYEVWSYRADLLLQGVGRLSLDKPLATSDYVSDGPVVDVNGRAVELASALEWTNADKIELVLSSCAHLSLKVCRVQLSLIAPLRKLEDWSGPLK